MKYHTRLEYPVGAWQEHPSEVTRAGNAHEAKRITGRVVVNVAQAGLEHARPTDAIDLAGGSPGPHRGELLVLDLDESARAVALLGASVADDGGAHQARGVSVI